MMRIEGSSRHTAQVLLPADNEMELIGLPMDLAGHVDDGSIEWDVHFDVGVDRVGRIGFRRLELVQREFGPMVTPSMVRGIKLGELLQQAVADASVRYRYEPTEAPVDPEAMRMVSKVDRPVTRAEHRRLVVTPAKKERRNSVTPGLVEEAMRLYEREKALGTKDAMQRVADEMGLARSTIGNYVKQGKASQ